MTGPTASAYQAHKHSNYKKNAASYVSEHQFYSRINAFKPHFALKYRFVMEYNAKFS